MSEKDRSLGMDAPITRRDFLGATLIGSGAMLLGTPPPANAQGLTSDWNGYAGIGDYARSNGNVASVVNAAHGVRDGWGRAGKEAQRAVKQILSITT